MSDPTQIPPDPPPKQEKEYLLVKASTIVAFLSGGIVYAVNNFEKIKPVIEHPAMLFVVLTVWTIGAFGFGGAAVYTLIFQPMERRFARSESEVRGRLTKAEALVSDLRNQERDLIRMDGERLARIAALERDVAHQAETLAELRQALQRMQSEQSLDRRAARQNEPPTQD